jgi:hypothetical protein
MEPIENNNVNSENNDESARQLTADQEARLAAFREKCSALIQRESYRPHRRRTTVKRLLGVQDRVRIVADMADGTHWMIGEVWPSTSQPMLDVLNHVNHRFRHDDGDDVVTWDALRKRNT